jgi:CRISPR-associated protein Csc2
MNTDTFRSKVAEGTVESIENTRQNRFTHILLLREVTAPARFTTDGETVNTMEIRTGDPEDTTLPVRAVDLFYRKQPGAERRVAKTIQRDLLSDHEECADDYMDPNEMNQNSVESVLFGSAAGDKKISQRSRVYYNSAYSLRAATPAVQQNTQTAAGDTVRQDADEGQGTWTPDFVKPGTLFPSIVTLDSATPEEVMFVLATIARTTRYGKSTSRGGNVKNRILDIVTAHHDGPANLELTQLTVAELAERQASGKSGYDRDDLNDIVKGGPIAQERAADALQNAYEELLDRRGIEATHIGREDANALVDNLQDEETLRDILNDQANKVDTYVANPNGS